MIIDQKRLDAGKRFVELGDELGMAVQCAMWVQVTPDERWQYWMVTPLLAQRGPGWIYDRLLQLFQKSKLPEGIAPLDILVFKPEDPWYRNFSMVHGNGTIQVTNSRFGQLEVHKLVSYRNLPNVEFARADIFDHRVSKMLRAA